MSTVSELFFGRGHDCWSYALRKYLVPSHEEHRYACAVLRREPDLGMRVVLGIERYYRPRPLLHFPDPRRIPANLNRLRERFLLDKEFIVLGRNSGDANGIAFVQRQFAS